MLELSIEDRKRYEMEYAKKVKSGSVQLPSIPIKGSSQGFYKVPGDLLREVVMDAHVDPLSHPLISNPLVRYRKEGLNVQIEKVEIVTKTVITLVTSK